MVTGLVGTGDAVTYTNPTMGQGVALADHPDFTPGFDGPAREDRESAVRRTAQAV